MVLNCFFPLQLNLHFHIPGKFSLIDLAGNERGAVSSSADEAGGCRDQQVAVGVERVYQVCRDLAYFLPEFYGRKCAEIIIAAFSGPLVGKGHTSHFELAS